MKEDIIFENKFDEYFPLCSGIFGLLFGFYISFISEFWWGFFIIILLFPIGLDENYLRIYLYEDKLIIKRPLGIFRKSKSFTNSDIIKVVNELPKWVGESSRIIIYTHSSKEKGKSFRFMNSGREMQRFFKALEGLGIVVEYPTPES